jgi:hypothetical protein
MHNGVHAVQGYSFLPFNAQYFLYWRIKLIVVTIQSGFIRSSDFVCLLVTFPFGTLHFPTYFDVLLSLLSIKGEKKKKSIQINSQLAS